MLTNLGLRKVFSVVQARNDIIYNQQNGFEKEDMASVVVRVRFHCKIESQQMSDRSVPTKLLESIENSLKEKT